MTKLEQTYNTLINDINVASEAYYYAGRPLLTDYEYDQRYLKLQELESKHPELITKNSPTQKLGAIPKKQRVFKVAQHTHPMLSLKTETDFTAKGAYAFVTRVKELLKTEDNVEYCAELKFDGLGINLKYQNGTLVEALTRGDGIYGEDVTDNVRMIRSIPKYIIGEDFTPYTLIVRGEVYMGKDEFNKLNQSQLDKGEKLYVNPRNAAAGSLRVLDPSVTFSRHLGFFAYTLVEISDMSFKTHYEALMFLQSIGFPVCQHTEVINTPKGLCNFHIDKLKLRNLYNVEFDGVVYKVNDLALQSKLGFSGKEPKWAVAHKYPAQEKETKLLAIDIQVGRTGKLTPVARLDPIFVGGATITNVTLHNEEETRRKDIRVGDTVIVRRAGDVIPEITGSLFMEESLRGPVFTIPSKCPICNSPVVKPEKEVDHRCTGGVKCRAQVKGLILHFIQRSAMNIQGLGEALVDQLLELDIIKTPIDLYKLVEDSDKTLQTLSAIEGMGTKSVNSVLKAIEVSKNTTLAKFIFALGIRYAGEGTAKRLVEAFKILDGIKSATLEDILAVNDIGPIVGNSVYEYFHDKDNLSMLDEFIRLGIEFEDIKEAKDNPFKGKTVVITGTLESTTRDTLKTRLESLGAIISNSVGKHTDMLIVGSNAGSKLKDADKFKVSIIYEQTLLKML